MDKLSVYEKKKYDKMFGCTSFTYCDKPTPWLLVFFAHFEKKFKKYHSITDFGCGRGETYFYFREKGLDVQFVDITDQGLLESVRNALVLGYDLTFHEQSLWNMDARVVPTNWIFCVDVLEHIPTEKVDCVLEKMSNRTLLGGMFSICLKKDNCGAYIKEKLHLTVKSGAWWLERLSQYFHIQNFHYIDDVYIVVFF